MFCVRGKRFVEYLGAVWNEIFMIGAPTCCATLLMAKESEIKCVWLKGATAPPCSLGSYAYVFIATIILLIGYVHLK